MSHICANIGLAESKLVLWTKDEFQMTFECIRLWHSNCWRTRVEHWNQKFDWLHAVGEWVERCAEFRILIYAIEKRLTQRMCRSMQQNRSCICNFAPELFNELCHIVCIGECPRSRSTLTRNSLRSKKMLFICVWKIVSNEIVVWRYKS